MSALLVLTSLPDRASAERLADNLIEKKVAACVNILPAIRSVYTWQGVPQVDAEQQLVIKTTSEHADALWELVRARHPYEVPEFLVIPVIDGSADYLRWVEDSVGPKKES